MECNISPRCLKDLCPQNADVSTSTWVAGALGSTRLGSSLAVTDKTVRAYLDLLAGAYMVRLLEPFHANLGKRLVKSPKVYLRDSGVLHALLGVNTYNDLLGHPVYGASWEGVVIATVAAVVRPDAALSHYRTSDGTELDLVIEHAGKRYAVESKASSAPTATASLRHSIRDIEASHAWIVAPVEGQWPLDESLSVVSLDALLTDPAFAVLRA